ncbi:polyketide synthase dehydratase domain-containing protein, partial [Actinomadura fulvescens]
RVTFAVPARLPGPAAPAMIADLCRRLPAFGQALDSLAEVVGPATELPPADPVTAYCLAVALGQWWRSVGVEPDQVTGRGPGIVAAAVLAGVFSAADGARLAVAAGRSGGADRSALARVVRDLEVARPRLDLVLDGENVTAVDQLTSPDYWVGHDRATGPDNGDGEGVVIGVGVAGDDPEASHGPAQPLTDGRHAHRRLLETLSRAWVKGVDVRWDEVNPRRPLLEGLPTYPFQHRYHQVPESMTTAPAARRPLRPAFLLTATGGAIAETVLSLRTVPFLDEHRVHGRLVVPGVALVELLLQAGERLFGPDPALADLTIPRAMALGDDDERRVQVVLDPAGPGRARARVFAADASGKWHLHMEARVTAADTGAETDTGADKTASSHGWKTSGRSLAQTLSDAARRCVDELGQTDFYQRAWHPSFVLGRSFQLVQTAWRGHGVAAARLTAPDAACAGVLAGVRPELLLLDTCVQLIPVGAETDLADGDRPVHIGTGYDRAIVHSHDLDGPFHCVATTRKAPDGTLSGDLRLTDAHDRAVADLQGVRFRTISVAMLDRIVKPVRGPRAGSVPAAPSPDALRSADAGARRGLILDYLVHQVAEVTGLPPGEVDLEASLPAYADSLMLAELQAAVERDLGVSLTLQSLSEGATPPVLAGLLAHRVQSAGSQ